MWRKEDGMEERGELESWERRNDEIEGVGKRGRARWKNARRGEE